MVRSEPSNLTTDPEIKFVPFTVSVKPASPTILLVGKMLVVVGKGLDAVNVAVSACALLPMLKVHDETVLMQVVNPGDVKLPLHPTKTDPEAGVAVKFPVPSFASDTEHVEPQLIAGVVSDVTVPDPVPVLVIVRLLAAITYGPTIGPPPAAAPTGWISSSPVSARAAAMSTRPLPVCSTCSTVPSLLAAERARRPMIAPLVRVGSAAFIKAPTPATTAAEVEVPLTAR